MSFVTNRLHSANRFGRLSMDLAEATLLQLKGTFPPFPLGDFAKRMGSGQNSLLRGILLVKVHRDFS